MKNGRNKIQELKKHTPIKLDVGNFKNMLELMSIMKETHPYLFKNKES